MKALDEYFLMVVFTLLLNRVHVFAIFMFNLDDKTYRDTHRPPAAVSAVFLSQLLLVSAREKK